MVAIRTLLLMLVASVAGCGARTDLSIVDGDGDGEPTDGGSEQCASIFEDCDGSASGCEEAFRLGCACGDPPGSLVAGHDITFSGTYNYRVRWTGEHFVVPINEPEAPRVEVFDATGGRRLRSIPGYLRAVDGTTLYVGDNDPYGEAWVQAFDAGSGDPVGSRRKIPLGNLIPLGGGDLAGQRMTERSIVPGREHHVYSGLARAESDGVTWTAVLPGTRWATRTELAWNGVHVLSVHDAARMFLYNPYANDVIGPIRYREVDSRMYSVDSPNPVLVTRHGWLAIWSEMTLDVRTGDLVTASFHPDGSSRRPAIRWRDEEARLTDGIGSWVAQVPNGEIAVLYTRTLDDRVERVMLRIDEDGRIIGQLGPPRRVDHRAFNGLRAFLWAGYSYAIAEKSLDVSGRDRKSVV